jgi:hypothetical protein
MPSHCQTVGAVGWILGHLIDGTQAEAVRPGHTVAVGLAAVLTTGLWGASR